MSRPSYQMTISEDPNSGKVLAEIELLKHSREASDSSIPSPVACIMCSNSRRAALRRSGARRCAELLHPAQELGGFAVTKLL